MHRAALAAAGIAGDYELFDVVEHEALERLWEELRQGRLDGLNVTVPHKPLAAARATCTPLAARLGAVNTLVRRADGAIVGHNTDLPGLVAAVVETWGEDPIRGPALVIGAGGAAPAALVAARALGAEEVRVWNRSAARAEALVARVGLGHVVADAREGADGATLVLQASSHGMGLSGAELAAAEAQALEVIGATARGAKVVDLVYRPRPTAWVRAAERAGRAALDGLGMLIHQAALAFELWIGTRAEVGTHTRADARWVAIMRAAALAELARREGAQP
jgi:shikimate dehydrogenase